MTFVFGYGSLVHRRSLGKGLRRAVAAHELVPAELDDWARVWGATELVEATSRPGLVTAARFLDLEPRRGSRVNGVLVRVTDDELSALRVREKSYSLFEVTGLVAQAPAGARVVTFASPHGALHAGDVVLAEYVSLVEEAFTELATGALERFRETTAVVTLPLVPGPYRFVDPDQNRLTTRAPDDVAA